MTWLPLVLHLASFLFAGQHVLLHKRDPRSAGVWLALLALLPVVGVLLYWAFGVNRVARKALRRRRRSEPATPGPATSGVPTPIEPLEHLGDRLSGTPLLAGNRVEPLIDGDAAYPAMLAAIAEARTSIGFLSYIFDPDETGTAFLDALCAASQRGVRVCLLVDGIGAWGLGPTVRRRLVAAGGHVASYWPLRRWFTRSGLNLRNHRKILVVDGTIGFTGGMNVSARHVTVDDRARPRSRDLHFRLTGPVVAHLADTFAADWHMAVGERLEGHDWFPPLEATGEVRARGYPSAPDREYGTVYELLLGALRMARVSVDIVTPYFIPDATILSALRVAGLSGVRVRVVLPRHTDHRFMAWAARACMHDLVESGVEVWEVPTGFVHTKLMVVDGRWSLFGSSNMDARSFRLNFEFNVEAWSEPFASELQGYLERHVQGAYRVTPRTLRAEPRLSRLRNQIVKLFSPYL